MKKKQEFLERPKDEIKLQKMFEQIGIRFLEQLLKVNQEALEAAKTKCVTPKKLKKFERTSRKRKQR